MVGGCGVLLCGLTSALSNTTLICKDHPHKSLTRPAPFSDDPEAVFERKQCDYNLRIKHDIAKSGKAPRRIRVYSDGVYDLFHHGHARQLMQAKNMFPNVYLIVGVCSDAMTLSQKGHRTVMHESERYEAVRHCRYVDEVVRDPPWETHDEFVEQHKIDFVAHDDDPYPSSDGGDVYEPLKKKGIFVATERTKGVSTSNLVARIVRDYDIYVCRNLARGYSAKELNISFLNEKKFHLQNKMRELKGKRTNIIENMGEKQLNMFHKLREKSQDLINALLLIFGRNGHLVSGLDQIWNEGKDKLMQVFSRSNAQNGQTGSTDDEGASSPQKSRHNTVPNLMMRCILPHLNDDYSDDHASK